MLDATAVQKTSVLWIIEKSDAFYHFSIGLLTSLHFFFQMLKEEKSPPRWAQESTATAGTFATAPVVLGPPLST